MVSSILPYPKIKNPGDSRDFVNISRNSFWGVGDLRPDLYFDGLLDLLNPFFLSDRQLASLLAWSERNADLLGLGETGARPAERRPAAPETPRRFRRYLIEGRWTVRVGRSNAENDELTHRSSAPGDLWFHAQGVTGSHVILSTGGRPEQAPPRIVAKAAALAALATVVYYAG